MAPPKAGRKQTSPTDEQNGSSFRTQSTLAKLGPQTTGRLKPVKKAPASKTAARAVTQTTNASPNKSSPSKLSLAGSPPSKGSIQSFFNAAPVRRRASQETLSRTSRASTPLELTETIDSDDEHGTLTLSKGSSTALALRKRKSHQANGSFGAVADDASLPASQKFRRTDTGRVPSMTLANDDKRPWTVQFAPTSLDELAVHKKKVADVKGWLEQAYRQRRNRTLILKGPAGCGKTTTLKLLAEAMDLQVLEWTNPSGRDQVDHDRSSTSPFEEFITRSGRSAGLTLVDDLNAATIATIDADTIVQPSQHQVVLVEEFPNTFSRTSTELQAFRSAIAQHLAVRDVQSPIPLIMVVSETLLSTSTATADSFTTHRLLGPELSVHPYIDTIEFNPIAPTILLKALEAVVVKEARKSGRRTTPGPAVLKRLTEFGDIRSAVSTLEFLCVRGDDEGNWSARIAFGKTKKKAADAPLTKLENEALIWISSRESTLGIWHAVGKVLYNKRIAPPKPAAAPPTYLSHHHRSLVAENDVNTLVNDIGTDTLTFIASLHENYLPSCTHSGPEQSLDTACKCLDDLSDADLLSLDRFSVGSKSYSGSATDTLRQDEMSFQLAVRGMLFDLPANVKRSLPTTGPRVDAHRMYYPASLRLWRKKEEVETAVDALKVRLKSQLKQITRARVDTAYSLANTNATAWLDERDGHEDANDLAQPRDSFLTLASKELLMECLPYLPATLQQLSGDKILLDLLSAVTHITGEGNRDNNADETADDEQDAQDESLPTDTLSKSRMKMTKKTNDTAFTATKAEQQMDALILEDDDIVDD